MPGNLTTEPPIGKALPSPFKLLRYGKSGTGVSEIFSLTYLYSGRDFRVSGEVVTDILA